MEAPVFAAVCVVLLVQGVWLLFAPRHHWKVWRPLWRATSGWQWRHPERMEPSGAGFAVSRLSGAACIFLALMIAVPLVLWATDDDRKAREACEEDKAALVPEVRLEGPTALIAADGVEEAAAARGLAAKVITVEPNDEYLYGSQYVQVERHGESWFTLGFAPRTTADDQRC